MHYKILKQQNKGFTLVELLISIVIIITAATAVVTILTASFRGSNKVGTIQEIRQAGNGSLAQMSKIIQYADSFEGVSNNGSTYFPSCLTQGSYSYLRVKLNEQTRTLSCPIAIDGRSLIDTAKVIVDPGTCSFVCKQASAIDSPVITINFTLKEAETKSVEKNATLDFSTTVKMRNLNQ